MAKMYLMCGISGSGKTTFSKQFAAEHNIKRLGIDDYYAKVNGDECLHVNFFDVWIEYFKAIHESEMNNEDIIIDTNALTQGNREQFIEWFPTFEHHLIYINCEFELCKKNNKSRKRQVPDERMEEMFRTLEIPTIKTENTKWKSITWIINTNNKFSNPIKYK